jgi:hypothetical protein
LAINPQDPSVIYAATGNGVQGNGVQGNGVFETTNGGASWTAVTPSLLPPNVAVKTIAINPQSPNMIYAGADDGTVFKSINSGASWTAGGIERAGVQALAINPKDPSTLYAGTDLRGVFVSTNVGASWAALNTGLPPSVSTPALNTGTPAVTTLAINPESPNTLYAGTDRGVFREVLPPACGNGVLDPGEQCDDGSANSTAASCCALDCTFQEIGSPCDDGNPCTDNKTCASSGVCGGTPLICSPTDQCRTAGTCDPATGCPQAPDNTPCDNGDTCFFTDSDGGQCIQGGCQSPPACETTDAREVKGTKAGVLKVDCAAHGAIHKRDFCQADGTLAGIPGVSPDTVIYSKARKRLNPRTGRVVLKLRLNNTGRKLFKERIRAIEVNVRFTLQTGGQQSRITRVLTINPPNAPRLLGGDTVGDKRR